MFQRRNCHESFPEFAILLYSDEIAKMEVFWISKNAVVFYQWQLASYTKI